MKLFPNLAGILRFYFGFFRFLILVFTAVWIFLLLFLPYLEGRFGSEPKMMISVGEIAVTSSPEPIQLKADASKPGSITLSNIRGAFQVDLFNKDPKLSSAVRWTIIPSVFVHLAFSWLLLTALRQLCGNIEKREVISESNLRLVKKSGLLLIAYTATSFGLKLWTSHVMSSYLAEHVTLSSVGSAFHSPAGRGAVAFVFPAGFISTEAGLVIGFMLILLAEAFRQGLAFKSENDLTV